MNTTKFDVAVLTNTELLICRPGRKMESKQFGNVGPYAIDMLHKMAIDNNVLSIWLTPGSLLSQEAINWKGGREASLPISRNTFDVRVQVERQSDIPVWIGLKKLQGSYSEKRLVHIGIPEHDSRWAEGKSEDWALADIEEPVTLLGALCYLQKAINGDVLYSPGWTGINTMKLQNKHRPLDTVKPERMVPHEASVAHDIMWTRPLSEYERMKQYIHFYDRNSMYVGATGGAEMGIGDAEHYDKEQLDELRIEKLPPCAVWRVTLSPEVILSRMPILSGTHWLTTPELYALAQIGNMDVEFHEAYVWQHHKRLLREWCNLMWQGRISLKSGHVECDIKKYPNVAARDVAYKLIKIIYKDAIGWLDPTSARETPKDGIDRNAKNEWVRPDWRKQIVGLARARMWLKMAELWHDYDMEPLAVYTDSLAYISDDPEPRTAVPNLMIRETGLGGFKHVRTIPVTSQVIALFDSQLSESQIMHEIKDMVGVGV